MASRSLRFFAFTVTSLLTLGISTPLVFSEPSPQHCERKDPNDPNSEEICIPLPGVPAPSPQPQPAPGGSAEPSEEPPHEAWESPNAGADDTGSGKPEKPAKEPSSSGVGTGNSGGSSSGSKKPSAASSSSGGKKPTGSDTSSSGSGSDSSSGSSRLDTVCGGQFCGEGDTLIGGVGRVEQQRPNRAPVQSDIIPEHVPPAGRNTSAGQVGTVVDTAEGLAVQTSDGLITLSPEQAGQYKPGDAVEIRRPESAQSNQNRPGKNDDASDDDEQVEPSAHTPEEVAPMLLVGVIGGMMGLLLPERSRRKRKYNQNLTKDFATAQEDSSGNAVMPDPDIGPLVNEFGDAAGNGWVGGPEAAHHPAPGSPSVEPEDPDNGPETTNASSNSIITGASTVGAWGADNTATEGELTDTLWGRYRENTGEPITLTTAMSDQILGQAQSSLRPNAVRNTPLEAQDHHHSQFLAYLASAGGPLETAKNTGEPQSGTFRTTWEQVSVRNPGIDGALGTFSVAFNTSYVVYPDGRVEYERVGYIYDWYNFGNGEGEGGNALALEQEGKAQPFRVTGTGSVISGECRV